GRDRCDDGALGHHPDLDRADIEIGKNRVHLRGDEIRRHVVDRGHAFGVLRRERGDDRGAVDAERRERLEISLDAGAATRIRARVGRGARLPPRPGWAAARSPRPRRSRAAARGSSWRESAETPATPPAPAAIASPALLASMPAMPHRGNLGARRRKTSTMRANPAGPIGGLGLSLGAGANTPPIPTESRKAMGAAPAPPAGFHQNPQTPTA